MSAFSIIYALVRKRGRHTRKKTEVGDGYKRGMSFHRPNQCKQLDIAGNISFLRTARRSTAKRAQTTATASKVVGGSKKKRKRIPVVGESLPCHFVSPPYEISTDTLFPIQASLVWTRVAVVCDPLSGHLFNLEGRKWKGLRSKLTPAFSSGKLKRMFYLLVECCEELQRLINEASNFGDQTVEVRELAAKFIIDVIGSCAFGIQINALTDEESEFHKAVKKLSKPSYKATLWRMLRTAMPRLYRLMGVQLVDPSVTQFFMHVVSQMISQRESNGTTRHDFMDLLIELKNKELDENTIAAQAFGFFVAGYETSSNTIAFCLYELALNQEIQDKTRREIHNAIGDGKLTYDAVQEMKYLDMVILETLRKYPPAPLFARRCEYKYRIPDSNVELPAGLRVVIPIYGLHHDPNYYPDPARFDPERFTEENKRTRHPYTYLPFGEGPRNCIGMRFALLQIKMGIIAFLKDHRIEICEKSPMPIKFSRRSLVTASEAGYWLTITSSS
ncbi:putative cytochrome P450 6a13 [Trachymyrmex cornetzi]|uniref:Putative cytochrome P450 6a13 n=1 Tax=Trachymyrmex cornetzi TaxID=471704 RepID=A0A195EDH6_9HYME|nr:putative cytochrome P450 6a13 [Trachymyrmex cornetzi]